MQKELNFIPLLCRAVSTNPRCYGAVNEAYTIEAYKASRESIYYDSPFINVGGLEQDRIARRFLGILLTDEDAVLPILRKGFLKVFRYLESKSSVTLEGYAKDNQGKYILDELAVLLFVALQKHIVVSESALKTMTLSSLYELTSDFDYPIASISDYDFDSLEQFIDSTRDEVNAFKAIDIITSRYSVDTPFAKLDKNEKSILAASYDCARRIKSEEQLLTYAYYLLSMCKAFREVKNEYFALEPETFQNNEKLLKSEIEVLNSQCKRLVSDNDYLKSRIEKLTAEVDKYESGESAELKDLRKRVGEVEAFKTELNALRELAFSLEAEEDTETETVPDANVKALLIGGTDGFRKSLSDIYPLLRTVSADVRVVDKSVMSKYTTFVFCTSYINHQLYYYCIDYARANNINVLYLNSNNIPQCIEKLNGIKSFVAKTELTVKDIAEQCRVSVTAVYQRMQRLAEKLGRTPTLNEVLDSALSARAGRPRKY